MLMHPIYPPQIAALRKLFTARASRRSRDACDAGANTASV
jgi:hypothetical protein